MQFEQLFFNQKASIHVFGWSWLQADLAAGCTLGPQEDTGTYASLPFFYWFMYLATTVSVLSCKYPICRSFRLHQEVWALQYLILVMNLIFAPSPRCSCGLTPQQCSKHLIHLWSLTLLGIIMTYSWQKC